MSQEAFQICKLNEILTLLEKMFQNEQEQLSKKIEDASEIMVDFKLGLRATSAFVSPFSDFGHLSRSGILQYV